MSVLSFAGYLPGMLLEATWGQTLWDVWIVICWVLFTGCALLMTLLILIRPGEGEGLASAFGGPGGGGAFGVRMTKPIDKIIRGFAIIMMVVCFSIAYETRAKKTDTGVGDEKPGVSGQEQPEDAGNNDHEPGN